MAEPAGDRLGGRADGAICGAAPFGRAPLGVRFFAGMRVLRSSGLLRRGVSERENPAIRFAKYLYRPLLEAALRTCDGYEVTEADVESLANWATASRQDD